MNQIPYLDARVDAMQKELLAQNSMLSARLAAMASELAAVSAELKDMKAEAAKITPVTPMES